MLTTPYRPTPARRAWLALPALLIASLAAPLSMAETEKAICEFYNHGEMKKDRTGPCAITRDGDEMKIELYKGKVYTFKPEEKRDGRYIDQNGDRLAEERDSEWKTTYKWKNQRLIVMHPGD